jgi:colanic acid biosynthesis glycosyl transferase WcaI
VRVHFIGINYWPDETGIAGFSTGRAEHLASLGHTVSVFTAPPYYPQWRVPPGYSRWWFQREERAGVAIFRCPLYVPARVTALRRIVHEASFIASAALRCLFATRPDVLVIASPPLGLAVLAAFLAWWWRVPYLFDVQDLQPDAALDLGMVKPGLFTKLLFGVERLGYRHAAAVSTITDAMRARIVSKGIAAGKVHRLALWAAPDLFALEQEAADTAIRRELGLGDDFLVLHMGNMGVKQGLDVVLDAASQTAPTSKVRYVLVGDGAVRSALESRAQRLGLSNVTIIPLLPREQFQRLLATAQVCLVTQQRTVADIVFPSKVLTLLAAAKPVIASVTSASEVAAVIATAGAGLVVPPEDPLALQAAVLELQANSEQRLKTGRSGRMFARERWERDRTLALFAGVVSDLAGTAERGGQGTRAHDATHRP